MSYNVRDDNGTFGPAAAVELNNGAGQSLISRLQVFEPVTFNAISATQFAESSYYTLFIAPPLPSTATGLLPLGGQYQVAGLSVYYSTAASGAAQFYVEIVPAGTADGSGNNVIGASTGTGYYSLATALPAAHTPVNLPLSTNVDNLQMAPNSRLNIYATTQATTGLVDFCVCVYLIRTL